MFLQYKLWNSHDGMINMLYLRHQVAKKKIENTQSQKKNKLIEEQIYHLQNNKGAVENLARERLGMTKKGEVYYRIVNGADAS